MEGELRMGAGAVLTVFFAATLVSAVFFGLGYSFGRTGSGIHFAVPVHSANAPAPSAPAALDDTGATSAQKPSAIASTGPVSATDANTPGQQTALPLALVPAADPAPAQSNGTNAAPSAVAGTAPSAPVPESTTPRASIPIAKGSYMVQVAAIASHKDAQTLAQSLQKQGINARVHGGVGDRFFHVQVGPFATRDAAEAMRKKVAAAGHRAILKPAP
jgi:DedD protein